MIFTFSGSISILGMGTPKNHLNHINPTLGFSMPSKNCLSKEFFIDPEKEQPNVVIVVGSDGHAMDVVSATMIAAKINTMTHNTSTTTTHNTPITMTSDEIGMVMLDTELDFARWKTVCDSNLILIGNPKIHITIRQLFDEEISRVDWTTSPGEVEYISNPYGNGCDILIIGGKDADARKETTEYLIDLSSDDYKKICENPCADVLCSEKCYDCDLWAMECVNGECVKDYIIKKNSSKCGYNEPTVLPSTPTFTNNYSFILNVILILAVIILIVLFYQKSIKTKTTEKKEKKESKHPKTSVCPVCGNKIEKGWTACPHCGTKLRDDTQIY